MGLNNPQVKHGTRFKGNVSEIHKKDSAGTAESGVNSRTIGEIYPQERDIRHNDE